MRLCVRFYELVVLSEFPQEINKNRLVLVIFESLYNHHTLLWYQSEGFNMSDLTVATTKPTKEGGSSSIKCPILSATSYTVWAMRMRILLRVHKVWDIVETEAEGDERHDMAMALLFQSIPETLILQVGELDTAKKVWDAIRARYVGAERVKEARLQTLMAKFDRLKMKDTETIDEFVGKLSEISSKSASLGEEIEEPKIVKKFLKCLPRKKYIHVVAALEQVLDLKTTTFEDNESQSQS